MKEWSSGYNTDIEYTYGYYRELNPTWLNYICCLNGYTSPISKGRYLELACGNGISLVYLAALHPEIEFIGIDFLPEHIHHASNLARKANLTNVTFIEADIIEISENIPDWLGRFDYICSHGTYTWVSRKVRDALIRVVNAVSKPGALVYLSYNTFPGWITSAPVQHLMRYWQKTHNLESRKVLDYVVPKFRNLIEAKSGLTESLKLFEKKVSDLSANDEAYVVHEYLHDTWQPVWFDQIIDQTSKAKLQFVSTAALGDLYIPSVIPDDLRAILSETEDEVSKQLMIDVIVNQSFRKDLFIKGNIKLNSLKQKEKLLNTLYSLNLANKDQTFTFKLSCGEIQGKKEVYEPIYRQLQSSALSLQQLVRGAGADSSNVSQILQAVNLLIHSGKVSISNPLSDYEHAQNFNAVIIDEVCDGRPYNFLLAPALGDVISLPLTDILMLACTLKNKRLSSASELAQELVVWLGKLNRTLLKDGVKIEKQNEIKAHTLNLATLFLTETLPNFKKLGLVR